MYKYNGDVTKFLWGRGGDDDDNNNNTYDSKHSKTCQSSIESQINQQKELPVGFTLLLITELDIISLDMLAAESYTAEYL